MVAVSHWVEEIRELKAERDMLKEAALQALAARGEIRDRVIFTGSQCITEPLSEALAKLKP